MDETRHFNVAEGLKEEDDTLPPRFHHEPLPETGEVITEEDFRRLLDDYYRLRGWR